MRIAKTERRRLLDAAVVARLARMDVRARSIVEGFVAGLQAQGLQLFLAGLVVTTVPLVIGLLVGKYVFKMKAPICLGACAGARTTTAALGAIEAEAKSKVPALGYTVTYAVGNTLLTVWGVAVVLLMS